MSDPTETWTWFASTLPAGFGESYIYSAASDGSSWLGCGDIYDDNGRKIAIAVGDAAGEPWDMITPFATPIDGYVTNMAYGGGRWVGVGGIYPGGTAAVDKTLIVTAADPYGTWDVDTHTWGAGAADAVYGDGLWAVVTTHGKVYTATNPAGTWTLAKDFSGEAASTFVARLAYGDGLWVIAFRESASPNDVLVYSATNPSGTWTARGEITSGFTYYGPCGIGYTPGGWFVRLETALATKSALTDASWTLTTGLPGFAFNGIGPGFGYGDGFYVAVSNSVDLTVPNIKYSTSITGPFTAIASEGFGGGGAYIWGGPFFSEDWLVVGDRGYSNEAGVLATPSSIGAGWELVL